MRAHYLLGCAYDMMGESPIAIDCFHKALDVADTSRSDCNYRELSRIHGQIAKLLISQHALHDALDEMCTIDRYARLADDTLMVLVNMDQRSAVYNLLGNVDSVIAISERVSKLFKEYDMEQQSARAISQAIIPLLDRGEKEKVRHYIDFYEDKSGFFDSNHNTVLDNKSFYYLKGKYYLLVGNLDSALYYFQKEKNEARNSNNLETAYWGLSQYFQHINKPDSVAKYALLSREMNDSFYNERSMEFYQRMHAQYRYERNLARANMLEASNNKMHFFLILAILSSFIIVLLSYLVAYAYRNRRIDAQKKMEQWREKYSQMLQAKTELELLKMSGEKDFLFEIADKEEQIDELKKQLIKLQELRSINDLQRKELNLLNSPIISLFQNKTEVPTHEEWNTLRSHVDQVLPDFMVKLTCRYPLIREEEKDICILLRLRFPLKQIAHLQSISLQNLNVIRKRLLKRIFRLEGSPKDFDKMLMEID